MADTKLAKIGLTPKEPWAAGISYEVLDVTLYSTANGGDGCAYVAMRDNIGVTPGTDDSVWLKLSQAGQSIYDLCVKYHDFTGTEEEFERQYQEVLQAARDAAAATNATNQQVTDAEALRVTAEQGRVTAENARADAESQRASAEATRENNETARNNAEAVRVSAESGRVSAETGRVNAESGRVSAENARESAETDRRADFQSLKTDMQTAIGQADAATAAAVALNEQVAGAEADRVTAETARETAESGRTSAESARVTAENGRVSAESGRVSAETARETQAGSDHTRAEADHTAAAADHTTAGTDHATAASDHTQAGADHTASEAATAAANTAAAAADAARESIQDDLARKANIDGSYETMSVGLAKNLEGRTDVTGSFLERTTGGDAEVANGLAQLQEVQGKSQVWNQLVKDGNFSNGIADWAANNVAVTISAANNKMTVSVDDDANAVRGARTKTGCDFIVGHKFFIGCKVSSTDMTKVKIFSGASSGGYGFECVDDIGIVKRIVTFQTSADRYLKIVRANYSGNQTVFTVENVTVHDLTLLFGSGNEPATVEEFESWLAENIGLQSYYPYNAGTVLNVNMTGIETLGFNLLDPATGKARIIGAYSDVYGNYYGITGTHGTITFTSDLGETSTITPDSDGKFLLEEPGELTVADAGADCSVFLWWDGTRTEHEDYERTVTNLDVAHIYGKLNGTGELVRVWPTGMPGIGDVKDSLKVVDGAVVAERKVGEVDMGSLTWTYALNNDHSRFSAALANVYASSWVPVIVNAYGYAASGVPIINNSVNLALAYYNSNIFLRNDAYSDAATFKTAMSGVLLYYELATPQTYTDLVYQGSALFADGTPVTLPTNYPVNNWSVERIAPQNSSEAVVTTAPELTCRYSIDAVETLNTHADEIENLYDELDELDARKPEKYGEYPLMTVGSANTIAGDTYVPAEFVARKTGGSQNVASGLATIGKVKGKTVVWNQLVQNGNFANGTTNWGTRSGYTMNIADGVCTITGQAIYLRQEISVPTGHKVLFRAYLKPNASGYVYLTDYSTAVSAIGGSYINLTADQWNKYSVIYTVSVNQVALIRNGSDSSDELSFKNIVMFDLTQMFGAGNEPTTVEEFEALYPLPYYEYNAGALVNNAATGIETVGFNQWDEVWENGSLNLETGADLQSGTADRQIRSKNYIQIIGGIKYYITTPPASSSANRQLWCAFYDGNKQIIDATGIPEASATSLKGVRLGGEFTAPSSARYMRFYTQTHYGGTYNHDICINLSDASKNGTYEPYWKETLQLNLPTLTGKLDGEGESVVICPDGLRSAGTAFDEAVVENGIITKIVKRIGGVDLGTLTWGYSNEEAYANSYRSTSTPVTTTSGLSNGTCPKYIVGVVAATTAGSWIPTSRGDKLMSIGNGNIALTDYRFERDAASLKAALSGVLLYYELAEPQTYVLDTPIPVGYRVDGGGTERRLPADTASLVIAPFAAEISYAIDARGFIQNSTVNFISKESMTAFLEAMKTANIISAYTVSFDASTQKYQYTMTKSS